MEATDDDAHCAFSADQAGSDRGHQHTLSLLGVNAFVTVANRVTGYVVDSFMGRDGVSGLGFGCYIVVIVAKIIFGIAASAIVMWFSRFPEYRAGVAGAQLAECRDMISALQRLKAESQMPDTLLAFGHQLRSGQRLQGPVRLPPAAG